MLHLKYFRTVSRNVLIDQLEIYLNKTARGGCINLSIITELTIGIVLILWHDEIDT